MYEGGLPTELPSITGVHPNSLVKSAQHQSPRSKPSGSRPDSGPLSAAQALAIYRRALTPFETEEIKKYSNIWFVGKDARKINAADGKGKNFGYDDDKGRYKCIKNDHIGFVAVFHSLTCQHAGAFFCLTPPSRTAAAAAAHTWYLVGVSGTGTRC